MIEEVVPHFYVNQIAKSQDKYTFSRLFSFKRIWDNAAQNETFSYDSLKQNIENWCLYIVKHHEIHKNER